jgi:hypothetical protein
VSKLNRSYAAFTWAKSIRHIRVSLSPRIWPARLTGISRIRVWAKASNSWVKCLLGPSQGGVTRYTLPSLPRRPRDRAHTITHSLSKSLDAAIASVRHGRGRLQGFLPKHFPQATSAAVSSTFNMKVEELASRRASRTRHTLPPPSNCPNDSSGVIAGHHSGAIKPAPLPLEIARILFIISRQIKTTCEYQK